ncbi:uncharacterized protein DC041_0001868 [Schistosoma bovis]|uniref:Uncharacterized protein n=1 Tax=Schistosoma bovis TaxID=6184 RepID=A0A430Q1T2_SCHBO|nr:uncharacterized protein DC041_0001868 [Schistosoma bovis]
MLYNNLHLNQIICQNCSIQYFRFNSIKQLMNNIKDAIQCSVDVAQNLNLLNNYNVTHIINLISNIIPNYFPEYFHYLSLIVYDNLTFQLNDILNDCFNFLNIVKQTKGCCFIHCEAGISRSPSIIIAYLMKFYNYSYDNAYNLVNNSRNICINVNFKSQLMRLN